MLEVSFVTQISIEGALAFEKNLNIFGSIEGLCFVYI